MGEVPKRNTQLQNHKGKDRCYHRKMLNNVSIKDTISQVKWRDRQEETI